MKKASRKPGVNGSRFRARVYEYFRRHGRDFPWRRTTEPYAVFVSEIMLQQTQTDRVAEKLPLFLAAFPDFPSLAAAPLRDVLHVWQGMGYNRRALFLHRAAREVVERFHGRLPATLEELESLPGIGPATARSISAFAFNLPVVFIETNIRSVFIHEFFPGRSAVSDRELLPLVELTLDRRNPRKWYNALMDYGVMLKERHGNPSRRSAHYTRPSPFKESNRRIRGAILRLLTRQGPLSRSQLNAALPFEPERIVACGEALRKEGFIVMKGPRYQLP